MTCNLGHPLGLHNPVQVNTYKTTAGWRRCIGCLELQVSFCKRATNHRALLRKMTSKDKASYDSSPPCIVLTCLKTSLDRQRADFWEFSADKRKELVTQAEYEFLKIWLTTKDSHAKWQEGWFLRIFGRQVQKARYSTRIWISHNLARYEYDSCVCLHISLLCVNKSLLCVNRSLLCCCVAEGLISNLTFPIT